MEYRSSACSANVYGWRTLPQDYNEDACERWHGCCCCMRARSPAGFLGTRLSARQSNRWPMAAKSKNPSFLEMKGEWDNGNETKKMGWLLWRESGCSGLISGKIAVFFIQTGLASLGYQNCQ